MKALLLYREHDFDLQTPLPVNAQLLTQDLELTTLWNAMARDDQFLFKVAQKAILTSVTNLDTILYRQAILRDCINNPAVIREMYNLTVEAIENERKSFSIFSGSFPSSILYSSVKLVEQFLEILQQLRNLATEHLNQFAATGFIVLFTMLQNELNEAYFQEVRTHLNILKFRGGVLISAGLGHGNKGINYTLRKPRDHKRNLLQRLFTEKQTAYTYYINDRDDSGARALGELNDRGVNLVANALAQSADHILNFFKMLRTELAFYVGCLNLYDQLAQKGEPVCFPAPAAAGECRHCFQGLYDISLALSIDSPVVGNNVDADQKSLVIITGANQGGKSTFLRSIGLAQLMMQCGMFVPAKSFAANVCTGLFTHYRREEDAAMNSGKLDEELSRMSDIVDHLTANSLVLFNESFAATNEREGSEIGRQIVSALVEKKIKVFFVSHQFEFSHGFYSQQREDVLFLRAERQADGRRSYKLVPGEPLSTSYGQDLYHKIFG